jgi:hypothetical protein
MLTLNNLTRSILLEKCKSELNGILRAIDLEKMKTMYPDEEPIDVLVDKIIYASKKSASFKKKLTEHGVSGTPYFDLAIILGMDWVKDKKTLYEEIKKGMPAYSKNIVGALKLGNLPWKFPSNIEIKRYKRIKKIKSDELKELPISKNSETIETVIPKNVLKNIVEKIDELQAIISALRTVIEQHTHNYNGKTTLGVEVNKYIDDYIADFINHKKEVKEK